MCRDADATISAMQDMLEAGALAREERGDRRVVVPDLLQSAAGT